MKNKINFVVAMLIFGSIGIFVKWIDVPSVQIVQWRTIIGSAFLLIFFAITRKKIDFNGIIANKLPLLISGTAIGSSWAFLFEAYKNTSVGLATIIYYTAPIMVFVLAPIIFKEKITIPQIFAIVSAVFGMILVNISQVSSSGVSFAVFCALMSAVLYAVIMITNKFIKPMCGLTSTMVQLMVAAVVMTIYCTATTGTIIFVPSMSDFALLLTVGALHTGVAMSLYIGSLQGLSPQDISIFSYIDPASALILAYIFFSESLLWYQFIGAILIFGGALYAQFKQTKGDINEH
ncbi:MAG: EamA family transporter [Clostridia bacterium]